MKNEYVSTCMNPVRQRIIQFLALRGTATTTEILNNLGDVSRASLYRHMKQLVDVGAIEVVEEVRQRGATERIYRVAPVDYTENTSEEVFVMVQSALMGISTSFSKYFAKENPDPYKDLLTISAMNLKLTDEDYIELLQNIGELLKEAALKEPEESSKERSLYLISVPVEK